jgi:hypothetical protein
VNLDRRDSARPGRVVASRPGLPETHSAAKRAVRALKVSQRGAQPRDSAISGHPQPVPETVRCHICHRDEPIARCEDCGVDLGNPHALIKVCGDCKSRRREARQRNRDDDD